MKKEEIVVKIGGLALAVIGSIGIAYGATSGELLYIPPGAFFWLIGVLAMATGAM